jgi:hypothetical protein
MVGVLGFLATTDCYERWADITVHREVGKQAGDVGCKIAL